MTDRLALADEDPPTNLDTIDGRKAYRKRLRLYAHRALLEQEKVEAHTNITQEEFEGRQRQIQASKFADTVVARALQLQTEMADTSNDIQQTGVFFPEEEDEDEEEAEPDLEETTHPGHLIDIPLEQEMVGASPDSRPAAAQPSFELQARTFMEVLTENSMNEELTWVEGDITCPDCREDETVDDAAKVSIQFCLCKGILRFKHLLYYLYYLTF